MTIIESTKTTIERAACGFELDDPDLAAASFLAGYSGRTLEAYRHDLRGYFQWAAQYGIEVLAATRSGWSGDLVARPSLRLLAGFRIQMMAASAMSRRCCIPGHLIRSVASYAMARA